LKRIESPTRHVGEKSYNRPRILRVSGLVSVWFDLLTLP
jgi:hypothetical protein